MHRLPRATSLLLLIAASLTACASPPVEPLVVAEAAPRAALTVEQAVPYRCPAIVFSPEVQGDYVKTLKATLLDYAAAFEECVRRDGYAVDLLTRVPGTPDPAAAPPGK